MKSYIVLNTIIVLLGWAKYLITQAITLLAIAIVFFLIMVPFSYSIFGIWLSEVGFWIAWVPLGMIAYEAYQIVTIESQTDLLSIQGIFFVCIIFNSITVIRMIIPFFRIKSTNNRLSQAMNQYLGSDYLHYIASSNCVGFVSCVKFKLSYYFNSLQRKNLNKRVTTIRNLTFRVIDGKELKLNVHYPTAEGINPVIIFIHGGGWIIGSKDKPANERICKLLASYGYTVFNINYRLIPPEYIFSKKSLTLENPQLIELVSDVDSAISFVRKNALKYNGNPNSLFLFGRSAGGHLALLSAFLPETYAKISGVIAFYPITDLEGFYDFYQKNHKRKMSLAGNSVDNTDDHKMLYRLFSPLSYVNEDNSDNIPPVFLATGDRDRLVNPEQSFKLFNRMQELGIRSVLLDLPWANHGFDQVLLGPGGHLMFKYVIQFLAWVRVQQELEDLEFRAKEHGLDSVVSREKIHSIHSTNNTRKTRNENIVNIVSTNKERYKSEK